MKPGVSAVVGGASPTSGREKMQTYKDASAAARYEKKEGGSN